jgi:hypothetical protein
VLPGAVVAAHFIFSNHDGKTGGLCRLAKDVASLRFSLSGIEK